MNARLFASGWRGLLLVSLIICTRHGIAFAEAHPNTVGVTVSISSGPTPNPAAVDEQVTVGLSVALDNSQVSQEAKINPPTISWSSEVFSKTSPGGSYASATGCDVSIPGHAPTATLTAKAHSAAYWRITVTATVTYSDANGNTWSGHGSHDVEFTAVSVDKLQYKPDEYGYIDVPSGSLYVAKGTVMPFKAIPAPEGAAFPTAKPSWGGSSGASGTGATKSVTFSEVSSSESDTKDVIATCGNSKTAKVVVYEINSLTVSDADDSNVSLTVPGSDGTELWVAQKPDGTASISLDVGCTPNSSQVKSKVHWQVLGNQVDHATGTFASSPTVKLTPTGGNNTFTVNALSNSGVVYSVTVKVVNLVVSNVNIRITDKVWKPFGTLSGDSSTFDPFYDDWKIGGHDNFEIDSGAWDAHYATAAQAQSAKDGPHVAKVLFDLSADAHVKMAVWRNNTWPASNGLVKVDDGQRRKGTSLSFDWPITNEGEGGYFAYVGAYAGNTTPSNPNYVEDGLKPAEAPSSPRSEDSGRRSSPSFSITRENWGLVKNISRGSSTLPGMTAAQWAAMAGGSGVLFSDLATYLAQNSMLGLGEIGSFNVNLLAAIGLAIAVDVDYADNGRPTGPPSGLGAGDSVDVIDWYEENYKWVASSSDYTGSYHIPERTHWTYYDFHSNPSYRIASFLDEAYYWTTYEDNSTASGTRLSTIGCSAAEDTYPYIWPPNSTSDMVYDW